MHGDSYIENYLKLTAKHEFPDDFARWVAVATVGFAVGRNVYLNPGYGNIYPNHYIVLVAGSGACRKGAAVGFGRKLIRAAIGDRVDRLFVPGKIYPEALIRALNKRVEDPFIKGPEKHLVYRPTMLFSPELGSFLSKGMQSMGMPDLLTEIYDCPDEHEHITKNSGVDHLKDVHVSLLGATTPKWMQENMTPSIFGEGFISRTILVYADKPKLKAAFIDVDDEMIKLRDKLIDQLRVISALKGEIKLTDEARQEYSNWYMSRGEGSDIETESGFYEREHDHILKLAMVFSISADAGMEIHPPHIKAAVHFLQQVRGNMHIALAGAQADPAQRNTMRVLSTIKTHGGANGITARDLGRRLFNYMDPETIQQSLVALRQTGMVESQQRKTTSGEVWTFYRTIRYMGVSPAYDKLEPLDDEEES